MSDVLLGIDVGTTSCKAAVVTTDGVERAHARAATPWRSVPGGTEVDPFALLAAAVSAARDALAACPGRVHAVGVTSMAETGILLDGKGEPVAPALAWHDPRGADEAAALAHELGERFTDVTGLPATPLCSLVKYRWLRAQRSETARGRRWLSVAEWIVRGLGGDELAELSLASRTGFLDVRGRDWWDEALAWADAPPDLLPEPAQAGTPAGFVSGSVLPEASGAVLAVGGHDHVCAAVGAGATRAGDVFDSCGTAEALVCAVEPPVPASVVRRAVGRGVTVGWHVLPGRQALLGGFESGRALQRFLDLLGVRDEEAREWLDRAALALPAGAEGLRVEAVTLERATLTGVGHGVSPAHVWRAALDAVAGHGAAVLAAIEDVAGPHRRLIVTGGGARPPAVRAVKRAAVGPFERPAVEEAGARGAALAAGCAAGLYPSLFELPPVEIAAEAPVPEPAQEGVAP